MNKTDTSPHCPDAHILAEPPGKEQSAQPSVLGDMERHKGGEDRESATGGDGPWGGGRACVPSTPVTERDGQVDSLAGEHVPEEG